MLSSDKLQVCITYNLKTTKPRCEPTELPSEAADRGGAAGLDEQHLQDRLRRPHPLPALLRPLQLCLLVQLPLLAQGLHLGRPRPQRLVQFAWGFTQPRRDKTREFTRSIFQVTSSPDVAMEESDQLRSVLTFNHQENATSHFILVHSNFGMICAYNGVKSSWREYNSDSER